MVIARRGWVYGERGGYGVPSIEHVMDNDPTLYQENKPYIAMDVPGRKVTLNWYSIAEV